MAESNYLEEARILHSNIANCLRLKDASRISTFASEAKEISERLSLPEDRLPPEFEKLELGILKGLSILYSLVPDKEECPAEVREFLLFLLPKSHFHRGKRDAHRLTLLDCLKVFHLPPDAVFRVFRIPTMGQKILDFVCEWLTGEDDDKVVVGFLYYVVELLISQQKMEANRDSFAYLPRLLLSVMEQKELPVLFFFENLSSASFGTSKNSLHRRVMVILSAKLAIISEASRDGAFHFLLEHLREDSDSFLRKASCECLFELYQKGILPLDQDLYLRFLHILIMTFIKEETKLVKSQLLRLISSIVCDKYSQLFADLFAKDSSVLEQINSLGQEQGLCPGVRTFWDVIALFEHLYHPSNLLNIGKDIEYIFSLLKSTGGSVQEICLPRLLKTFAATKNNKIKDVIGSIVDHLLDDNKSADMFLRALSLAVIQSEERRDDGDLDLGQGMLETCKRLFQEIVDPTKIKKLLSRLLPPFQQVLGTGFISSNNEEIILGCSISIVAENFAEIVYSSVFDPLWYKCSCLIQNLTNSIEAPANANVLIKELKILIDLLLILLEDPKISAALAQERLGAIKEAVFPTLLAFSDLQDICVKLALALPRSEEILFFSLAYLQDLAFFPPQGSVNLGSNYVLLLRKILRTQRLLLLRRVRAEFMKKKGRDMKGPQDERPTENETDVNDEVDQIFKQKLKEATSTGFLGSYTPFLEKIILSESAPLVLRKASIKALGEFQISLYHSETVDLCHFILETQQPLVLRIESLQAFATCLHAYDESHLLQVCGLLRNQAEDPIMRLAVLEILQELLHKGEIKSQYLPHLSISLSDQDEGVRQKAETFFEQMLQKENTNVIKTLFECFLTSKSREVAETLSKLAGPAWHRNLRTSNDSSKQLEELSSFLLAGICSDTSMGAADIENSAFFLSLLPPSANALKSFSYTVECQSVSIVERIRSGQISRDALDFLMGWVSSAQKSKQMSKSMEEIVAEVLKFLRSLQSSFVELDLIEENSNENHTGRHLRQATRTRGANETCVEDAAASHKWQEDITAALNEHKSNHDLLLLHQW